VVQVVPVAKVTVQVDPDQLECLIKSPQAGLAELIWIALDADAKTVTHPDGARMLSRSPS
jgi:hypothetical protein